MEEKPVRGPGGRLALWALYLFCFYSLWAVLRYVWVMSGVEPPPGSGMAGAVGDRMLNALLGLLVLGTIGSVLGVIVWITRPRVY
ncbi:hypothetical protein GWD52_14115 [Enterobacteriaceae bacterium 4M9]|nr:hypothetical protein [Enterobacteriaceae bacterium 4M9]